MTMKIQGIQILRAVAACAVVVVHAVGRTHMGWPESATAYPVEFAHLGHAGVDLFFVISGFLMAYLHQQHFGVEGAPRKFIVRRLARIVPIYWVLAGLALAVNVAAPQLISDGRSLDWAWVVGNFLFVPWPDHTGSVDRLLIVGWSLDYEMLFYVLFTLALFFRRGLALLFVLMLGLVGIGHLVQPEHPVLAWVTNRLLLEFLSGVAIAWVVRRFPECPKPAAVALITIGVLGVGMPQFFSDFRHVWMRGVSCALIMLGTVWLQSECRGLVGRALVVTGDASYSIYLTQVFSLPALVVLLKLTGIAPPAPLTMVLLTLGAIVAGVLFWRFFERPITELLKRRIDAKPTIAKPRDEAPALS
jgi:exopolysaccharide production protein ExoZ